MKKESAKAREKRGQKELDSARAKRFASNVEPETAPKHKDVGKSK